MGSPTGGIASVSHGIVTPDAVVLELETAGVASRVCAAIIDLGIQLAALSAWSVVVGLVGLGAGGDGGSFITTAMAVGVFAILLGYPVVSETIWRGRTIGKKWMGLRAVTVEGAPITLRHATLRMMGGLVDKLVPPGGVTGALFVLGTRRNQRVGDLLAGTIVVREPARTALPSALWFPVPLGLDGFAATLDPTAITVEQYTLVRAFLMRVDELHPDARMSVATTLADRLAPVVRLPRPPHVHPESYLLCAIARYQRRSFPSYEARAPGAKPRVQGHG